MLAATFHNSRSTERTLLISFIVAQIRVFCDINHIFFLSKCRNTIFSENYGAVDLTIWYSISSRIPEIKVLDRQTDGQQSDLLRVPFVVKT